MQVLGDLIKLPGETDALPLPWWHRAPLGLLDGTTVHVGLTKNGPRPVGEIIVSVLDPDNRDSMFHITACSEDRPGILERSFGLAMPLNIALAEAVTMHCGQFHEVEMICEPYQGAQNPDVLRSIQQRFIDAGYSTANITKYEPFPALLEHRVRVIEHGWVRGAEWKELLSRHSSPKDRTRVDLTRAVVSADTDRRMLRYVFPLKGTRSIRINHADVPGALQALSAALLRAKVNILSALLRRGGAAPKSAVLIAVIEPTAGSEPSTVQKRVELELRSVDPKYRVDPIIYNGRDAQSTITIVGPNDIIARIPDDLLPKARRYRQRIPEKRIPVFFSRRFFWRDPRAQKIEAEVRRALDDNGCCAVEAVPANGETQVTFQEVSAWLWLARAGLVVVTQPSAEKDTRVLSPNLVHEYGYLQGQGKPVRLLVDGQCADDPSLREWSIMHGVAVSKFDGQHALEPNDPQSIYSEVSQWAKWLKQNLG